MNKIYYLLSFYLLLPFRARLTSLPGNRLINVLCPNGLKIQNSEFSFTGVSIQFLPGVRQGDSIGVYDKYSEWYWNKLMNTGAK